MKKSKFIFYLIFFIFHLGLFIFTLVVDHNRNNFDFLFAIQRHIPNMKYFALFGVLLFLIDFIIANLAIRKHNQELEHWKNKHNELKAKMYDMQEESKSVPEVSEEEDDTKSDDEKSYTD